jgi:hypothetical protein
MLEDIKKANEILAELGFSARLSYYATRHRVPCKAAQMAALRIMDRLNIKGDPAMAVVALLSCSASAPQRAIVTPSSVHRILLAEFGLPKKEADAILNHRNFTQVARIVCAEIIGDRTLYFRPGDDGFQVVEYIDGKEVFLASVGPRWEFQGLFFFSALRAFHAVWLGVDSVPFLTTDAAISVIPHILAKDAADWARMAEANDNDSTSSKDDDDAQDAASHTLDI